MTKVSPTPKEGGNPIKTALLSPVHQESPASGNHNNACGDGTPTKNPVSTDTLLQIGGTKQELNVYQPQDKIKKRLWWQDVFIFGLPCNIMTIIRLVQLLFVNLSLLILPTMSEVHGIVEQIPGWVILPTLGVHSLVFMVEESTLFEFPPYRRDAQLRFAIFISMLYAVCEVCFGLICAVIYCNQYWTSIGFLMASVLYVMNHWYSRITSEQQSWLKSATTVSFDGVTRPETKDKRLNIGPQLVFPVPEEYSMPGGPTIISQRQLY